MLSYSIPCTAQVLLPGKAGIWSATAPIRVLAKKAADRFGGSESSWFVTLHKAKQASYQAGSATEQRDGLIVAPASWHQAKPQRTFKSRLIDEPTKKAKP